MQNPKISIIVPVYNVEEYLPKCLDSLINQTLKEIEIICVNDGSTDNSLEILQKFAKKDERIKIINQRNQGVSVARNQGIDLARGEYVMFVDSDDYLELEACQLTFEKITNTNSDIVIFDYYNVINNYRKKVNYTEKIIIDNFYFNDAPKDFFYIMTGIMGKVYRKNIVTTKFNKELKKGEDTYFFWITCLKNNPKIATLKLPLYNYIQRLNGTMSTYTHIQNCEIFKSISSLLSLNDFKTSSKYIQLNILDRWAQSIWWELYTTRTKFEKKVTKKYIQHLEIFLDSFNKYSTDELKELIFLKKIKKELKLNNFGKLIKILNDIFSITNKGKHKIINIFGIKIKIKHLKGQYKKEQKYINKLAKEENRHQRNNYILFDCLNGDISECIDAYSLFLYMKSVGKLVYYVVLKNTTLYQDLVKNNKIDKYIIALDDPMTTHPGDFLEKIYPVLSNTKAIITAYGIFSTPLQQFIKKSSYVQYIFIQHGQTFLKETVMTNGYLTPNKFDKILISSEQEYRMFKKYKWLDKKLIKCGLPRWDLLNTNTKPKEKSIFIMFTWRRFNQDDFEKSLYKKNLIKLLKNITLQELLKKYNCKIYFAPHHSLYGLRGINFNLGIDNIEIADTNKVSEYIKNCSCLLTDLSSVAFDFMYQNKPVICYILDKGDPILGKYDKIDTDSFDYKQYLFPNVYFDENKVIEKLQYYIENNFEIEPEVKDQYEKFFYTKENIRAKLVEEIDKACINNKT